MTDNTSDAQKYQGADTMPDDGAASARIRSLEAELEQLRDDCERLAAGQRAAENLAASRHQWLAQVSHEMRNPMTGILGMARLTLDTHLSPEQREYIEAIHHSADSLLTLVNDILDHARIASGKVNLEHIPFKLATTIVDAARTLEVVAADKGLQLNVEVDPDLPTMVMGDPGRLRQVVLNLLGNAIKFTNEGSVSIRASCAESSSPEAADVVIAVTDTGIGIPADRLAHIFEPFTQADDGTARRFGGTGLGLSICRQFAGLMGGEMRVESEVGRGSTFSFSATLELADDQLPAAAGEVELDQLRTLIVADHSVNRSVLIDLMETESLSAMVVDSVGDAPGFIEKAEAAGRPFDLIIFDLQSNGLETAGRVLESLDTSADPILIVPSGSRGDAARCRELGIRAYLTGRLTPAELGDAIKAVRAGTDELVTRYWIKERRRTLRVLVADDSPTNRMLATRILERQGHHVMAVPDGDAAVAAYATGAFDIILLDIEMPVMDGIQALKEIRSRHEANPRPLPIVAVSGHVAPEDRQRFLDSGFDDTVPKPFRPEELLHMVERLVP